MQMVDRRYPDTPAVDLAGNDFPVDERRHHAHLPSDPGIGAIDALFFK